VPSAAYNKFNNWVEDSQESVNNQTDTFTVALTAAANAPVATNATLSALTQIAYTNLSTRVLTTSSSSQTSGTYSLVLADLTLTASGGAVATFRYVVIYDDTPTSPADPLVCWFDYGGNVTLNDTETLLIDFGSSLYTAA
jgi:hypothetical protein